MPQRVYSTLTNEPQRETDEPEQEWLEIPLRVDPGLNGYRLDRFLKARITRLSRSRIQTYIDAGQVRLAGATAPLLRAATRLRAGQEVVLSRPAPREPDVVMDYTVIHHDSSLMVIDKPAGLPVHPSASYHRNTLTALMRTRLGPGHGWEMAHRLDRETSGLMLFGRRRERPGRGGIATGGVLKRWFQERRIHKHYLAIVWGHLDAGMTIDAPIGPAIDSRIRVKMGPRPVDDGGLPACTEIQPERYGRLHGDDVTLVRCRPQTGRQHQIRVHLAVAGFPVVGDKLYGAPEEDYLDVLERSASLTAYEQTLGLWRQALHAVRVELPHPQTRDPLRFEAPWPAELEAIIPLTIPEPVP